MHGLLVNLLIGIAGGIYSSIIVSRVFLLREELEEELDFLRKRSYYFGFLTAVLDSIEMILKLQSDTSEQIAKEIRRDPDYLNTHDIIRVSDVIQTLKKDILDKTIEKICQEDNPLLLKQKQFIELKMETEKVVRKYKDIKQFTFQTIDNFRKEIQKLEKKYRACLNKRSQYLFERIIKDKAMIVLGVLFIAICLLTLFVK